MPTGHILVVEDHLINRQMLQAQLAAEGWECEVVATGQAALEKLAEALPVAVVSDYILEDMTGIELLHKIRAWERSQNNETPVPMILYSGMPVEYLREQSGSQDYMAILTKPISRVQLRETLAPLLMGKDAMVSAYSDKIDETARELLYELVEFSYQQLKLLRASVLEHDMDDVRRHAHALRGSAAVLRQTDIVQACADIDALTYGGSLQKVNFACGRLHDAIDRLAARAE